MTTTTRQNTGPHDLVNDVADTPERLRTTIESTFATVRHRTKITRGSGSRAAGPARAFKLIEAAQDRWRAVNGQPETA